MARPRGIAQHDRHENGQAHAQQPAQDAAGQRTAIGGAHLLHALVAQGHFLVLDVRQLGTNGVHGGLAAIAVHYRQRRLEAPGAAQFDGLLELGKLVVQAAGQLRQTRLLAGVAPGQLADSVKAGRNDGQRRAIGLQIPLITGEQEAALAGLRVLGAGQDFIERRHRLLRLDDLEVVVPDGLDVLVGHQAADHEKDNDGNQGQRRSFFGASTVQRS